MRRCGRAWRRGISGGRYIQLDPAAAALLPADLIIVWPVRPPQRDPLANLTCYEADFDWATRKLMEIAGEVRRRSRAFRARRRL